MKNTSSRDTVIGELENLLGTNWFLRPSEDFDGRKGGIWTNNERTSKALDGNVMYDMYGSGEVHPRVKSILDKHGWFAEPYDSGTLMLWPD